MYDQSSPIQPFLNFRRVFYEAERTLEVKTQARRLAVVGVKFKTRGAGNDAPRAISDIMASRYHRLTSLNAPSTTTTIIVLVRPT